MKKTVIAVSLTVVAVSGFAGVQQLGYQDQARAGAESLVAQIDETTLFGENFDADLQSHQGELLASRGVIVVSDQDPEKPTEFQLAYTIDHGITTLLGGATYRVEITNPLLEGGSDETITTLVFNGQPVVVEGAVRGGTVNGVLTLPPVNLREAGAEMTSQPATARFLLADFDAEGSPAAMELDARIPALRFQDGQEGFSLSGGTLTLNNDFDGVQGTGTGSIAVAEVQLDTRQGRFVIESFGMEADTDIGEELVTSLAVSLGSFSGGGQRFSDAALKYRLAGLDGQAFVQLINAAEQGAREGWSDQRMTQAFREIITRRADALLALNPSFELQSLQFSQNGTRVINATGIARLEAQKLPQNYLKDGLESPRGPDPQALMGAAFVDFSAELSQEAQALASLFNPMMAAMIAQNGDRFSFHLEDGRVTLNGAGM